MLAINSDLGAVRASCFGSTNFIPDKSFAPAFPFNCTTYQPRNFYAGFNETWSGRHAVNSNLMTQKHLQSSQGVPQNLADKYYQTPDCYSVRVDQGASQNLTNNINQKSDCPLTHIDTPPSVIKQKTPMTQVVELARFNRISHQYVLQNESGPAHRKTFVVKLILGENEQFEGEGLSIKKAQQNAAAKAIEKTKLPKPPQTTSKQLLYNNNGEISPTVRLNSILLKMNLNAEYANFPTRYPRSADVRPTPPYNEASFPSCARLPPFYFSNASLFRYALGPPPPIAFRYGPPPVHTVRLKIGRLDFFGRGATRQAARHDAAQQAIGALQSFYNQVQKCDDSQVSVDPQSRPQIPSTNFNAAVSSDFASELTASEDRPTIKDARISENMDLIDSLSDSAKSPISIIYELASSLNMSVEFVVLSESGPAHDRLFVVEVQLVAARKDGVLLTHRGSGPCKKAAKSDACAKFIELVVKNDKKLFANYLLIVNCKPQTKPTKPKRETIIKDSKMDPNYGEEINPISRLVQVQQAKKEPEPKFELIQEIGQGRYKEYVIQVTVGEDYCQATGPNKKLAKRSAAELMLEKMGLNKPLPKAGKPVLKQPKICQYDDAEYEDWVKVLNSSEKIDEDVEKSPENNLHKRRVTFFNVKGGNFEQDATNSTEDKGVDHSNQLNSANVAKSDENTGWNTTEIFSQKRTKKRVRSINAAVLNLKINDDFNSSPALNDGSQVPDLIRNVDHNDQAPRFA